MNAELLAELRHAQDRRVNLPCLAHAERRPPSSGRTSVWTYRDDHRRELMRRRCSSGRRHVA